MTLLGTATFALVLYVFGFALAAAIHIFCSYLRGTNTLWIRKHVHNCVEIGHCAKKDSRMHVAYEKWWWQWSGKGTSAFRLWLGLYLFITALYLFGTPTDIAKWLWNKLSGKRPVES